jgi:exopolysaccharide production protein ExoQ
MACASVPQIVDGTHVPTTERWFAGTVLLVSSGAFSMLIQDEEAQTSGARAGTLLANAIWISIYLVTAYFIWKCPRHFTIAKGKAGHLLVILVVACASVAWSEDKTFTFVKAMALLGTSMVGYYLAVRFSNSELLLILARVLLASEALSLVFIFFLPAYGVGSGDFAGMWQGIYPHKNLLGMNMSLAFLVLFVLSSTPRKAGWAYRLTAALSLVLVLFSQSATSLVLCAVTAACLISKALFRNHLKALLVAMAFLLTMVLMTGGVASDLDRAATAVDRDMTLTGRTELWATVWIMVIEHPLLGYGYGAFWRGLDGPSAVVWKLSGFQAFYSHNGFLDVWLDLGIVGLILVLFSLLISFRAAFWLWRTAPTLEGSWPFLFLIYLVISNMAEGSLLRINFLPWILYIAIALQLSSPSGHALGRSQLVRAAHG